MSKGGHTEMLQAVLSCWNNVCLWVWGLVAPDFRPSPGGGRVLFSLLWLADVPSCDIEMCLGAQNYHFQVLCQIPPLSPEAHPSLGKVGAQEVGNWVGVVKWKPFWDEGKVLKIQKTESATGDLGLAP